MNVPDSETGHDPFYARRGRTCTTRIFSSDGLLSRADALGGIVILPAVFDTKPEVLAGEPPDAIFAADLWAVVAGHAHHDYLDSDRFFAGAYLTDNLKVLVRDIVERLAGSEGATPIFKLETGFGGGKTHSLIACVRNSAGRAPL